jgi:DNA-binding LacI/PurR family transcriptional regulator
MAALCDLGISVPGEVAIIGFGDVEMGAYLRPSLTTLSSDPKKTSEHVRRFFEEDASEDSNSKVITIKRSLILRNSA